MATDNTNKLFWLYFAEAIKTKAKANFGDDKCFFLGSEILKGPPGGSNMPEEFTNRGIFDFANYLLSTNDLFYSPSSLHGYVDALDQYLTWADPEATPSPQDQSALNTAQDLLTALDVKYDRESKKAKVAYAQDKDLGILGDGTDKPIPNFVTWYTQGNAPSLVSAIDERTQAKSNLDMIKARISGPKALSIQKDQNKLKLAQNHSKNSYTMKVYDGAAPSQAEVTIWKADPSKAKTFDPDFLPLYNAPGYLKFIQDQMVKYGTGNTKYGEGDSIEFTVDANKSTSDFHFDQTKGGANVGVSWPGWFTVSAGGEHSESKETIDTGSETSSVKVKVLFDEVATVPVSPGAWNTDVSQYKLRGGAPAHLKSLARVSQIIVASRMGYEITLGSTVASSVDTKVKQATSAGGSISILGIPISLGGQGGSESQDTTHRAEFSSDGRTIKVIPKGDDHTATIIGVVGEKFNITAA